MRQEEEEEKKREKKQNPGGLEMRRSITGFFSYFDIFEFFFCSCV